MKYVIGKETFEHSDLALISNSLSFGAVTLLGVEDVSQLLHVNQKVVFKSNGLYGLMNGWLLEKVQLHIQIEICCISSKWHYDSRKRFGKHKYFHLPEEFVKIYLNNYSAGQENKDCIVKPNSKIPVIASQDSDKAIEKNHVPYLPTKLILMYNIDC